MGKNGALLSIASVFAACGSLSAVSITNGTEWVRFRYGQDVNEGSILDFSDVGAVDRPAGSRHGRLVIGKDGHLVGEKSGERVRLVGANLNFSANTLEVASRGEKDREKAKALEHAACDRLAGQFRAMGYNSVRFHHIDVILQKGNWNTIWSDNLDETMLDRLDYMFYAMKQQGMYITTDLYQMRRFHKDQVAGANGNLEYGQIKGLLPVVDGAFVAWTKFAAKLMNHVNPYTGLAWKDDPALAFVVAVNEDTLMSICGHVPPRGDKKGKRSNSYFDQAFGVWKGQQFGVDLLGDIPENELWMDFLIEKGAGIQRKYGEYLRSIGVKAPVSGVNWWDLKFSAFEREELGLVDNHGYVDHPNNNDGVPWWNQSSNTKCSHAAYQEPVMKAPTRIFGKPMAITEWQFCMPNQFRAESGPTMGAYASLQDWDATYRFAWSHDGNNIINQIAMNRDHCFDMANDPLNQLSDRINVMLFRRGDVSPAKEAYCYAVTREDAIASGMGDMWAKGLFANRFVTQGFLHRIGSQAVTEKNPLRGNFKLVCTNGKLQPPKSLIGTNRWTSSANLPELYQTSKDLVSDTGEIVLNRAGRLAVATPFSETIVAYPKGDAEAGGFTAGGMHVAPVDTFTVVSAMSRDGKPLRKSRRVLLMHLTNIYNTNMQFDAPHLHCITSNGRLPYLARCGSAATVFQSEEQGLKLFALRYNGTRIREIPMEYSDGAYRFTLCIKPREEAVMAYELGTGTIDIDPSEEPYESDELIEAKQAIDKLNADDLKAAADYIRSRR